MRFTAARILFVLTLGALLVPPGSSAQQPSDTGPGQFVSVSAGKDHTCATTRHGKVLCWGSNSVGALGTDSGMEGCDIGPHREPCSTSPIPVRDGLVFTSITAGAGRTCGLSDAGVAYCWGINGHGAFGIGFSGPPSFRPVPAASGLIFQSLSVGEGHSCGVTTSGKAFCWGLTQALGTDVKVGLYYSPSPVPVAGGLTFRSVAAGRTHACGLTPSGKAYCWGQNMFGNLGSGVAEDRRPPPLGHGETAAPTVVPVAGDLVFASLSAGLHTCGVTTDGSAYCWGLNNHGQLGSASKTESLRVAGATVAMSARPVAVAGGLTFRSVTAGGYHSCGLTIDGLVYCWGRNKFGELGLPGTPGSATPVAVSGTLTFQSVAAGWDHTCGVTSGGAIYCWGLGRSGALGTDARIELCPDDRALTPGAVVPCSAAPVPVKAAAASLPGPSPDATARTSPASRPAMFTSVSAGGGHTCALAPDNVAYCWGSNATGQLGSDSAVVSCEVDGHRSACSTSPIAVSGGLRFRSVSAGGSHTCGVTNAGLAHCWGGNGLGELGNGFSNTVSEKPGPVLGALAFQSLTAGTSLTCGVTPAGAAYCWGDNQFGQLGDGTLSPTHSVPTRRPQPVGHLLTFKEVAIGQSHACGVAGDGQTYCWGFQGLGALGDAPGMKRASVKLDRVSGGLAFQSLTAGVNHTCGLRRDGAAFCWGRNDNGQLGDGSTSESEVPVRVAGRIAFASLSAGGTHTCGVVAGGQAFCWGGNESGQVGVRSVLQATAPLPVSGALAFQSVSAGLVHTCGLTTIGALYCWGSNVDGRLGSGMPLETCGAGVQARPCSTTPVRVSDPK